MTATGTGRPARRLRRRSQGRLVGGVASGLAEHLALPVTRVRIAFALLAGLSGFGLVLYLALWVVVPLRERAVAEAVAAAPAGLAAAERSGLRGGLPLRTRPGDVGQLLALLVMAAGIALLVQAADLGVDPRLFWPLLLAGLGLALIWRTSDEAERRRLAAMAPRAPWIAAIAGSGGAVATVRLVGGVLLVALGIVAFLVGQGQLRATLDGLLGLLAVLAGIGLVLGPYLWRLWRDLESERRQRIVSQERADMAAHLHDSVLQTLALIQQQAHDPREVVRLARGQERDLRSWLYDDGGAATDDRLAAAITRVAAEVEDAHRIPVEVVTVGDAPVDERTRALLAATREALVNAAKHSGAERVDVYAEATPDAAEVYVRDRGKGFDLEAVPDDRLGVRRSILGRMQRHGGTAEITSAPGEGTEVRLSIPLSASRSAP